MWLTPRKWLWTDVIYFLRIAQHVPKLVEQSDVHEEPNAIVLTPKIKKYLSNGHSACQCPCGLMKTIGVSAVSNTGASVVSSMSRLEKFFGPGTWTISPFQQLEHISPRYNGWSHALTNTAVPFLQEQTVSIPIWQGKGAVQWLQKILKTSRYNNNSTSLRLSFNCFQSINFIKLDHFILP